MIGPEYGSFLNIFAPFVFALHLFIGIIGLLLGAIIFPLLARAKGYKIALLSGVVCGLVLWCFYSFIHIADFSSYSLTSFLDFAPMFFFGLSGFVFIDFCIGGCLGLIFISKTVRVSEYEKAKELIKRWLVTFICIAIFGYVSLVV